jgi:hypothetical protein
MLTSRIVRDRSAAMCESEKRIQDSELGALLAKPFCPASKELAAAEREVRRKFRRVTGGRVNGMRVAEDNAPRQL